MNPIQKNACYNILIIFASTLAILAIGVSWGWPGAWGGLGLAGLLGFSPLFYRKKCGSKPIVDERDQLIQLKSYQACYVLAFSLVLPAAALFVFNYGVDRSIPVIWVLLLAICLDLFFLLVWSLAILLQYGRERP